MVIFVCAFSELFRKDRQVRPHRIRLIFRPLLHNRPILVRGSLLALSVPPENKKRESGLLNSCRQQKRPEAFPRSRWIWRTSIGSSPGVWFLPAVGIGRIRWLSKCSLQYPQAVREYTETRIAFHQIVYWQCIESEKVSNLVCVYSHANVLYQYLF